MTSFATAVPPDIQAAPSLHRDIDSQNVSNDSETRTSLSIDEFAVENDIDDMPLPPIGIPKHHAASIVAATGTNVDARRLSAIVKDPSISFPAPGRLPDRARRPSAIRADSAVDTIASVSYVIKDLDNDVIESVPTTRTQTVDSTAGILNHRVASRLQFSESPMVVSRTAKNHSRQSVLHFAALCWCFMLEGWNDGSVGPLLPVIQDYYSVGFAIVSMLFVFNCCGFVIGAGANVWLNEKFGFGKVMVLGSLFQVATYAIQSPAPPFPVLVLSFFLAGFGMSLQNAQGNGFVGSLKKDKSTKLMMLHAAYGLGAFCSPLVATHFSQTRHWSFHYIISTGIAVSNTIVLCAVFRFKRQEDLLREIGQEPTEEASSNTELRSNNLYRQIFSIRAVHFLAIFALIYIGVEVTIGGWIVTFIIRERDGGPTAGYISSGFFGGLTIGRLALMYINKKVGEHTVVFFYVTLSIALEVTIWFVPSIIENAVAVSFIGMLLGPLFPILVGHATRILPAYLFTGCVGWITGVGMAGSAALPFITGILAAKYGIRSLQPFLIAMMCTMVGIWALVPKARRLV